MSWLFPQPAKIIRSRDDSAPKVPTPKTIHDHPGCQRIFRRGNPSRQFQSAALLFRHSDLFSFRPSCWHPARHFFTQGQIITPQMNFHILRGILRHTHCFERHRKIFFQSRDFLSELLFLILRSFLFFLLSLKPPHLLPSFLMFFLRQIVLMKLSHYRVLRERLRRHKDSCKPIIILNRNRVDLMIMATCTTDRHS